MTRSPIAIVVGFAVLAMLVFSLVPLAPRQAQAQEPPIRISEFVASNESVLADSTGAFEDWIELENTTDGPVDLAGWSLSDGGATQVFAGGPVIPAGERLVVFASGEPSRTTADEPHLAFKLAASGEPLILRDPTGTLSQPSWPTGYPSLPADIAWGIDSSGTVGLLAPPTPGQPPGLAVAGVVAAVSFSETRGYYDSPLALAMSSQTDGVTIRYTTDGTIPTVDNGTAIAPGEPIDVATTTILRAIATRDGWLSSEATTATYLFGDDIVSANRATPDGFPSNSSSSVRYHYGMNQSLVSGNKEALVADLLEIPTISVVTDPDHLFDRSTGIYENPFGRGIEWERPASVELINSANGDAGFQIDAGIRIRGGASRAESNPKHSMHVRFRDEYDGDLEYDLFPDQQGAPSFEAISLTASQNGSWTRNDAEEATFARDLWSRRTQGAMGQPYTRSEYVNVFLNGHYWGVFVTQERVSNQWGADYLGGSEDDYDVITNDVELTVGASARDGSIDAWHSLWPLVSDGEVDDDEFATLQSAVDLVNLADHYVLHYLTGERDGSPAAWSRNGATYVVSNNWRTIRNSTGTGDGGKWKFIAHDTEIGLCWPEDTDNTPPWNLDRHPSISSGSELKPANLHEALLTHPGYRQVFTDRVARHMVADGGVLTVPEMRTSWDRIVAEVSEVIDLEAARWGDVNGNYGRSDWQRNVDRVRNCLADRHARVKGQIQNDGLWPTGPPAPTIQPGTGAIGYGSEIIVDAGDGAGTIWVTFDGSDPRAIDGSVSPAASSYDGPITAEQSMQLQARILDGDSWSALADASFTVTPPTDTRPIILNEWNAVSPANALVDGDTTLGTIPGNGGNWFELVVTQDHLDLRGWTIQSGDADGPAPELEFTDDPLLADLRAGTIITIADQAMTGQDGTIFAEDASYWPETGDWWIHLVAGDGGSGRFVSSAAFDVTHNDWQLTIRDSGDVPRFGPAGEGIAALGVGGINSSEVGELEQHPTEQITAASDYGDGDGSSFGSANNFADQAQSFGLRPTLAWPGDANCDDTLNVVDSLVIAQYAVGNRQGLDVCEFDSPLSQINKIAGDLNQDGDATVVDSLIIARCAVGIVSDWCPPNS